MEVMEENITDFFEVLEKLWDVRTEWENLGLALGVQRETIKKIKRKNRGDDNDCLKEMLDARLKKTSLTWSGLCEALKKSSVARNNVAESIKTFVRNKAATTCAKRKKTNEDNMPLPKKPKIEGRMRNSSLRSDGAEPDGSDESPEPEESRSNESAEPDGSDGSPEPEESRSNGSAEPEESLDSDYGKAATNKHKKRRRGSSTDDEIMQLDIDLESIQEAFTKFKLATKLSLELKQKKRQTIINDLTVCLLGIPSKRAVKDRTGLLEHYSDNLNNAKTIDAIFQVMEKFTSFLDYLFLKDIINKHGEPEDEINLKKYTEQLENFLHNWKVKRPLHVKESTKHQTKWKYKLDTDTLKWYKDIKKDIAKFVGAKVREVVLVEIKPGCVELIFALPTTAVERLLSLTLSQIAEVAEWTPTVLNVTVVDGRLKDSIIYEPISVRLRKTCRSETPPNVDLVSTYLEQKRCDINIREDDELKRTPLMWALKNKYIEIAKLLLKYKAQVNIQDKKGWSTLMLACRAGDLEIVQGIVALGAEIDLPTNEGWTPLMWAAQEGHAEMARFLLEKGAFVDFPDENGWTPVMQASQEGHVDVINILLDHNAKVNHLTSSTTWCALMAAAKNMHSDAVDTLLKRGAQVDIQRDDGSTTLQVASYYSGNSGIIDTLINHGANVDHVNKDGMTALMLASSKGHLDVVQALRSGGADLNKEHTGSGWTALFFAAKAGNCDVFRELLCRGAGTETSSDKVENVARMSASHEELLSDLGKYKKISEWKKDAEKLALEQYKVSETKTYIVEEAFEQTRKSWTLVNTVLGNFNDMIETSCRNERAPAA